MNLDRVDSGRNVPEEINVIIEIPAHSDPVKYEVDKDTGAMFVDRFMSSAMHYPCNYGYVPHTLSADGDPVDVLVLTSSPLISGSVIKCRPVGVLVRTQPARNIQDRSCIGGRRERAGAARAPQRANRLPSVVFPRRSFSRL